MKTIVIFASDSTGLSAENMGLTLMSQFAHFDNAEHETISFIKTEAEALKICADIKSWDYDYIVVFSTFSDKNIQRVFAENVGVAYFDLFTMMLPIISDTLGEAPIERSGTRYIKKKDERAAAIDYALEYDDGQKLNFDDSDIVLVGLSRSGKTPTALWLALHYGLKVGNYPVTEDDFQKGHLPAGLKRNLHKSVLLLPSVQRLHQLRTERFANSEYASIRTCSEEIKKLHKILSIESVIDVSNKSIEEIAASAIKMLNLHPKNRF